VSHLETSSCHVLPVVTAQPLRQVDLDYICIKCLIKTHWSNSGFKYRLKFCTPTNTWSLYNPIPIMYVIPLFCLYTHDTSQGCHTAQNLPLWILISHKCSFEESHLWCRLTNHIADITYITSHYFNVTVFLFKPNSFSSTFIFVPKLTHGRISVTYY
jgi:hypothetical protein